MRSVSCLSCLVAVALVVVALPAGEAAATGLEFREELCKAVDTGSRQKVEEVLKKSADVNKACAFTNSEYPLEVAAKKGSVDIGKLLIKSGAKVNQAGFLGYTPLLRAGENFNPEFMELLLSNGADVNAKLLDMKGLNLNLGLDVLSLTTAAFLRKYRSVSDPEKKGLTVSYEKILDILYTKCLEFKTVGDVSKKRLESENHPKLARNIEDKVKKQPAPGC